MLTLQQDRLVFGDLTLNAFRLKFTIFFSRYIDFTAVTCKIVPVLD